MRTKSKWLYLFFFLLLLAGVYLVLVFTVPRVDSDDKAWTMTILTDWKVSL